MYARQAFSHKPELEVCTKPDKPVDAQHQWLHSQHKAKKTGLICLQCKHTGNVQTRRLDEAIYRDGNGTYFIQRVGKKNAISFFLHLIKRLQTSTENSITFFLR